MAGDVKPGHCRIAEGWHLCLEAASAASPQAAWQRAQQQEAAPLEPGAARPTLAALLPGPHGEAGSEAGQTKQGGARCAAQAAPLSEGTFGGAATMAPGERATAMAEGATAGARSDLVPARQP